MAANPLAPLTAAQITNQIAGYTRSLPKPLTPQQISQQAQGLIAPTVKGLTDRSVAAETAGAGAISGYANALADRMGSYGDSAKQIYGDAEAKQAATDNALASDTSAQGSQLAQALGTKMDAFGAGPAAKAAFAAPQAATGAGAAGALLGTGSASLSQLIANEAAARDLAAKQPDLTRQQGLADLRDLGLASNKTLADNVAKVQEQLPSIVQGLRQSNDAKQTNIAQAGEHVRELLNARNDAIYAGQAKNATAETVAQTKADAAVTAAKTRADAAAKVAQTRANAASTAAAAKDAKPNATLSRSMGYVVDSNGNAITNKDGTRHLLPGFKANAAGQVVKAPPAASKLSDYPNLSKTQVVHLRGGVSSAFYGVPVQKDVNGKVVRNALPPVNYPEAITEAVKAGYSRAAATKMANHFYMPGQRGRPSDVNPATNPAAAGPPRPKP